MKTVRVENMNQSVPSPAVPMKMVKMRPVGLLVMSMISPKPIVASVMNVM